MVWNDDLAQPWYFMKEISSDGDLSTVDVIFPASPLFLLENADLLKLLLLPVLAYANNETNMPYTDIWAPHHLGFYPVANIETKDQENMPIEETGNLMMMIAAAGMLTGNNFTFVYPHYFPLLTSYAEYLVTALPDPGNQLCTDDFEGPIPHDSNLALKGIIALDCFAYISKALGMNDVAQHYTLIAHSLAKEWMSLANPNNTDHYNLRYDQPGWSLKYNLLFQEILGLQTFPSSVIQMELDYYLNKQSQQYGVPLDVRHSYTKFDWLSWVAAIAPQDDQTTTLLTMLYNYAQNTPSRVPLSDWYDTISGAAVGFQARTVVGGLFSVMLVR